MISPRVLLLRAGVPSAELRARVGDYPSWVAAAAGDQPATFTAVAAFEGEALPDARDFDAVMMSGSPLSITDFARTPWMQAAGRYVAEVVERGQPFLGVCFGHQLLAQAMGGATRKNPCGREIGTVEVRLTGAGRAHPILGKLAPLRFQATHSDEVSALPPGAALLAENAHGVQAFAVGARALGVQFHPELSPAALRAIIESRKDALVAEGLYEAARDSVIDTPAGPSLLRAWLRSAAGLSL